MDEKLHNIFIPDQEEDVPFIGDVINLSEMENLKVDGKKIIVTAVAFNGHKLLADVIVNVDFSNIPPEFDHVIVGCHLTFDPKLKEMPAIWNIAGVGEHRRAMKEIPADVEVSPGPLNFKSFWVMPIDEYASIKSLPSHLVLKWQYVDIISALNDKIEKFEKDYLNILMTNDQQTVIALKNFAWGILNKLRANFVNRVKNIDSDNYIYATVYMVKTFFWLQDQIDSGNSFLHSIEDKYSKKKEIISILNANDIKYVRSILEFEKLCHSAPELYSLSINLSGWDSSQHIFDLFLKIKEELTADFVALDLDVAESKGVKPFVIKSFKRGHCQSENIMQDIKNVSMNLAKCTAKRVQLAPKSRSVLDIPCPGFDISDCPAGKLKWVCYDCRSQIYFGHDDHFYCFCGGAKVDKFKFKCGRANHGDEFLQISNRSHLTSLKKIDPLNIVVLGQSGVGKSTWINAFVNYMTFKTLEEARSSDFIVPIPVKFTVTEANGKQVDVVCGHGEVDENLNVGESATQNCKEYNIIFENKIINLIDTPGLGDTRGVEEDKKNVKKILEQLGQIDVIHGICLVLKPNEARLTVLLKYCLKEILSNLHKSSKENLIFCFTHSRQTFYRAGETLPTLKALLHEIDVNPSCLDRSFHMDNEAFRFLCCQSANIKFLKEEEESFAESWDRSAKATKMLLESIAQIEPHRTSDLMSLNRSRNIILSLIPFMVEISENIERNLKQLEDHKLLVSTHEGTLEDLKNQRFSTQIDIERDTLSHPRTVCADEKCIRYEFLAKSGERTAIYKTHCHPHCYLSGQTPDVYPNPELRGCAAMRGENCYVCGCSWSVHMHIWYEQRLTEKLIKDDEVEKRISEYKDANELKADIIAGAQKKIASLEKEKQTVIGSCVKFACFLKANAIVAFNDSFLDYLNVTLRGYDKIKHKTQLDLDRIKKMEDMKNVYIEEKKIFADASQKDNVCITVVDIAKSEKDLYDLPIHGKQLKDIMEKVLYNHNTAPRDGKAAKMIVAHAKKGLPDKVLQNMDRSLLQTPHNRRTRYEVSSDGYGTQPGQLKDIMEKVLYNHNTAPRDGKAAKMIVAHAKKGLPDKVLQNMDRSLLQTPHNRRTRYEVSSDGYGTQPGNFSRARGRGNMNYAPSYGSFGASSSNIYDRSRGASDQLISMDIYGEWHDVGAAGKNTGHPKGRDYDDYNSYYEGGTGTNSGNSKATAGYNNNKRENGASAKNYDSNGHLGNSNNNKKGSIFEGVLNWWSGGSDRSGGNPNHEPAGSQKNNKQNNSGQNKRNNKKK